MKSMPAPPSIVSMPSPLIPISVPGRDWPATTFGMIRGTVKPVGKNGSFRSHPGGFSNSAGLVRSNAAFAKSANPPQAMSLPASPLM
jgi:hypothetical protein